MEKLPLDFFIVRPGAGSSLINFLCRRCSSRLFVFVLRVTNVDRDRYAAISTLMIFAIGKTDTNSGVFSLWAYIIA